MRKIRGLGQRAAVGLPAVTLLLLTRMAPKSTRTGGPRTPKRLRLLALSAAMASALGAFTIVPQARADVVPTITFVADNLPASMVNAHWNLETGTGDAGLNWIPLASGTVPAGGMLNIPVALSAASQTVNNHFMLVLLQPLGASQALLGNALVGLLPTDLFDGNTVPLTPIINQVTMYATDAEAAAASSCPSCTPSSNPGYLGRAAAYNASLQQSFTSSTPTGSASSAPALQPAVGSNFSVWSPYQWQPQQILQNPLVLVDTPSPLPSMWGPQSSPGGSVGTLVGPLNPLDPLGGGGPSSNPPCPLTQACVAGAAARPTGDCQQSTSWWSGTTTKDCVDDGQDIHADAFRGWSNKVPGLRNQFVEHYGFGQAWDNGYRTQKGPFSVNEQTTRQYGQTSDINFLYRGDCWSPAQPGDNTSQCSGQGWDTNWGEDSWRWEKHTVYECDTGSCNQTTFEILFDNVFNGGNTTVQINELTGDGAAPAQLKTGYFGANYARWTPDTDKETKLQDAIKTSNGTEIDISFSDSYGGFNADGGQNFKSSDTITTENDQGNHQWFRGPASGNPWAGGYVDYDGNHQTWQWDYWTCYFNSKYIGATSASQVFTGNTQCWDYSQAGGYPDGV
jgi:hypothetical protein